MAGEQTPQFSETDVQSLGQKLAEFSQSLTEGEQIVLTRLLQYAMPEGSDVQGFSFEPPDYSIDRKLLVVGLLDMLYPDDLGPIDSQLGGVTIMADNQTVSESDLHSLATKLAKFTQTLTPGEQAVLMEQLKQPPAADEDVQGYQYNYLYQQVAEARRADLLREAEQARLAASARPPRRPGMVRVAIGRMGMLLVGLGTRMEQVAMAEGTATHHLHTPSRSF